MDDAGNNVIPLSRRRLLRQELMNAIEWLDDLDSPLRADPAQGLTVSERIRSARELQPADTDRTPAA
jgi:hypothetical protein